MKSKIITVISLVLLLILALVITINASEKEGSITTFFKEELTPLIVGIISTVVAIIATIKSIVSSIKELKGKTKAPKEQEETLEDLECSLEENVTVLIESLDKITYVDLEKDEENSIDNSENQG